MKDQTILGERRGKRFSVNQTAKITFGILSSLQKNGIVTDINQHGFRLISDWIPPKSQKIRLSVPSNSDRPSIFKAIKIWAYFDTETNKYLSGWKFDSFIPGLNLGKIFNYGPAKEDRRVFSRRKIQKEETLNRRNGIRRIEDILNSYNLFKPAEGVPYRRLKSERRNCIRRTGESSFSIEKRSSNSRRIKIRRHSLPKNNFQENFLSRNLGKILESLRDLIIFASPLPIGKLLFKDSSFAFITHPRNIDDVSRQYPFARVIPESLLKLWLKFQWPVIGTQILGTKSDGNTPQKGWLIFCPLTAKQMLRDRKKASLKVLDAIKFAEKVNAKIIGLGAFTSIVTKDGLDVIDKVSSGITTGNALSAATAIQNVVKATSILKKPLNELKIAIVGAAGNVGSVCALNFIGKVQKLMLIDINTKAVENLKLELQRVSEDVLASSKIEIIHEADIILAVTNAPGAIVKSEHLKSGAIVVDCAQPKNVSEKVPLERKDVIVIESAILNVPDIKCDFDLGIGAKEALGCMAETIVLDKINWHKHFSTGKLTKQHTKDIMAVAKKAGIEIAYFRHSLGYVNESSLSRIANPNS